MYIIVRQRRYCMYNFSCVTYLHNLTSSHINPLSLQIAHLTSCPCKSQSEGNLRSKTFLCHTSLSPTNKNAHCQRSLFQGCFKKHMYQKTISLSRYIQAINSVYIYSSNKKFGFALLTYKQSYIKHMHSPVNILNFGLKWWS